MIAQQIADHIFAELGGTGFTAYTITSTDRHPIQNGLLGTIAGLLNSQGMQTIFRNNITQQLDDRGIVIIYDGVTTLQRNGVWDKIFLTPNVRYIVSVGHSYFEDEFEGDYILESRTDLTDTDGGSNVEIWKRIKVRV